MIKKCIQCGKDFEAARDSKKTCSDSCKTAYSRSKVMPGEEEVPVVQDEEVKIEKYMNAEQKHEAKWGNVCTLEEWKQYPAMCENKAQCTALRELYSKFTAKELVAAGVQPPKWKEYFSTYEEIRTSTEAKLEELGLDQDDRGWWGTKKVIDYSKWK